MADKTISELTNSLTDALISDDTAVDFAAEMGGVSYKITLRELRKSAGEIINVKDFGATGNGVADDTSAIASAVTAAGTGGVVMFPPGTYITDTVATTAANQTFDLGSATIRQKVQTATVGPGIFAIGHDGARIFGGTVDGQKSSQPADGFSDSYDSGTGNTGRAYRAGVRIDDADIVGLTIVGVRFLNLYGACVAGEDVAELQLTDCHAEDCNFELVFMDNTSAMPGYLISNNRVSNMGSGHASINANAILIKNSDGAVIRGNTLDTFERNAIKLEGTHTNIVIVNNSFDTNSATNFSAIQLACTIDGGTIAGNIADNTAGGINAGTAGSVLSHLTIAGNHFINLRSDSTCDGIRIVVSMDHVVIANNVLADWKRYGIRIDAAATQETKSVHVNGNILSSSQTSAESAFYWTANDEDIEISATGNTIQDTQSSATGNGTVRLIASSSGRFRDFHFLGNKVFAGGTTHRSFWAPHATVFSGKGKIADNYFGGVVLLSSPTDADVAVEYCLSNTALGTTVVGNLGTAAPTRTPIRIGEMYLDTTNDKLYVATGTASSADFIALN